MERGKRRRQPNIRGEIKNKISFTVCSLTNISLQFLRDAVKSEDRIELELDRNVQVLSPAQAAKKVELPPDFYTLPIEELKREQQSRTEALEKQMQLRTKAMREKDELREIRKYKFALIRVRFPDGLYLQVRKLARIIDSVLTLLLAGHIFSL